MNNFVLKLIKWITLTVFFLSAFSLDSGSWTPTITLIISGIWLIAYGVKNNWFESKYENTRWDT